MSNHRLSDRSRRFFDFSSISLPRRRRPKFSSAAERLEPRTVLSTSSGTGLDQACDDGQDSSYHAEADVPLGVFTPKEIAAFESYLPNSSLSSKTPAPMQDGGHERNILTFVLDFKEAGQANTSDIFGNVITTFDVTAYGFAAGDFNTVASAILAEVDEDYFTELAGTVAGPPNEDLRIDFIIGNIGTAPAGVSEYYFVQIGTGVSGPHSSGTLGVAGGSVVRNSVGGGPSSGIAIGDVVASVFTDAIVTLGGLSPSNALTSGNLGYTTYAVGGTLSHEIGHTLSLSHINKAGSTQPTGKPPLMGTGAIDLPNQDRIGDREFSLSGVDGENGNAARQHIQQLVNAIGLHDANEGQLSGTVFEDANGDGDQDAGEDGLAGWRVFLDENGNDAFDQSATSTLDATDVPKSVIDQGTVQSTLTVAGLGTVSDLNVRIDIDHTWDSDLDIFLVSPGGIEIELSTDNGGSDDNYDNTTFDDEAGASITSGTAPFAGSFRPEGTLSQLDGLSANGVWTLRITDDEGGDVGTLNSWRLVIASGIDEASVLTDAGGDYSFDFLGPGDYAVRLVLEPGYEKTAPAGAGYDETLLQNEVVTGLDFGARVESSNQPPEITSTATPSVVENDPQVLTVTATDADLPAQTVSFSITGGVDQAFFSITTGGSLTFNAARDYESPADANGDNVYLVQVTADDGNGGASSQDLSVTVAPANDNNPVFTSSASPSIVEGSTAVIDVTATDADLPAQTVSFSITGGVDQAFFSITTGGSLTFNAARDYESPADANGDNVYLVQVTADDGNGGASSQDLSVTVAPANDNNPVFTSSASLSIVEGSTAVIDVTATDADLPAQTLSFSITGGVDMAQFSVTSGGALSFVSAPSYFNPADANGDNVYLVQITADDGNGGSTAQDLAVTVASLPYPDIRMLSATADGATTLTLTYEILTLPATDFSIGVYRSTDHLFDGDVSLATLAISGADLTVGSHVKTFTIGSGGGNVPLPNAGAAEVSGDYFLLAVADPTDAVVEADSSGINEDNVAAFSGVYKAAGNSSAMVHGTAGDDSVTVSGSITVNFNGTAYVYAAGSFQNLRVRSHGGNDTVNGAALAKALFAYGGDGNDSLTGGGAVDSLFGGAGVDSLVGNGGNDSLAGEGDDDSLAGGVGNDSYLFDVDGLLGTDTIGDTSGNDTVDFSSTGGQAVTVNLGITGSQNVHANLSLTLGVGHTVKNAIGGELGDSLTGDANANVLTGGKGDDTLAGGAGNDTYAFDADGPLGSDTLVEAASGGTDTLDFTATTTQSITLDLSNEDLQAINANLSIDLSTANQFENAKGGAQPNSLTGNELANTLTGGAAADTLAGGLGNDTLVGLNGGDTLDGGVGDDNYTFDIDGPLGSDTIVEAGAGGGGDTLNFSTSTNQAAVVDLSLASLQVVHASNLSLTLGAGDAIENIIGTSKNDSLTGNDLANTLTGGPGNDALDGGAGNDVYLFDADAALGADSLVETNVGGIDTLNFSATTNLAVSVNLSNPASQNVNGNLSLTLGQIDVFENAIGGSKNDTLTGNALANVLVGGLGDDALAGGTGDDTYSFDADLALGIDTLAEAPGGGIDLLDFSQTTGAGVLLDLALVGNQVLNSKLTLNLSSAAGFEMVVGTSKNDTLRGNGENNVLIGGAGVDSLLGFGGRDLLVAGTGADSVQGGDEEDIVIGGKLTYFDESTKLLNRPAIDALMTEWTRTGANSSYAERIINLRAGVGPGAAFKISSATATADGSAIDALLGEDSLDWFWKFGNDTTADLNTGGIEIVN